MGWWRSRRKADFDAVVAAQEFRERLAAEVLAVMRETDGALPQERLLTAVLERLQDGPFPVRCEIVGAAEETSDPDAIYLLQGESGAGKVVLCQIKKKRTYEVIEVTREGVVRDHVVMSFG